MHRLTTLILLSLTMPAVADDWGAMATISSTMGVQGGKLCLGEASRGDIGCPAYAPSVSPTGTLTTTAISLTTGGTNWGYLASNASYLPNLNTTNISATTLNGIAISQLAGGTSSTMISGWPDAIQCDVSGYSYIFYHRGIGEYWLEYASSFWYFKYTNATNATGTATTNSTPAPTYCDTKTIPQLYATGRAFNFLNSGGIAPTGAIMAFDLASCPTGWSEYTAARGRFLRGIDNGAGNDPSGTRVAGNVQADLVGSHRHNVSTYQGSNGSGIANTGTTSGGPWILPTELAGGAETRPKNVAVLFCRKD